MNILALETATEACSVAVLVADELFTFHEIAPRRHGELLLPAVDRLLAEAGLTLADIDAIAFGRGPGAFTGVRIAVAAAQGLAFGTGKPLVPVSTLAALAQGALDAGATRVWAAIDARMGEVYAAPFTADADGLAVADGDEWLGPLSGLVIPDEYERVGTGFERTELPTAAAVARIAVREFMAGHIIDADHAAPTYLRDNVTNL